VSEKSTRNDVGYATELQNGTELLRFFWVMQFWLVNSLPNSKILAMQS
jgi:hypothetical protein